MRYRRSLHEISYKFRQKLITTTELMHTCVTWRINLVVRTGTWNLSSRRTNKLFSKQHHCCIPERSWVIYCPHSERHAHYCAPFVVHTILSYLFQSRLIKIPPPGFATNVHKEHKDNVQQWAHGLIRKQKLIDLFELTDVTI